MKKIIVAIAIAFTLTACGATNHNAGDACRVALAVARHMCQIVDTLPGRSDGGGRRAMMLLGNLPPCGRGVYANGAGAYDLSFLAQFDFAAINASRGDAASLARSLVARGVKVWFYDFGSGWQSTDNFAATIATYEALIKSTGATGGIVDAEGTWPSAPPSAIAALAAAIGASIGRGFRWGVTSYPEGLAWCGALAKVGAWGSPQMYGQTGARGAWYRRWESTFSARMVIPSIALWPGRASLGMPDFSDPLNYGPYLKDADRVPLAAGAIGWTANKPSPAMLSAFMAYQPWGNAINRALFFVRDYGPTPVGIAAIALAIILTVASIVIARRS